MLNLLCCVCVCVCCLDTSKFDSDEEESAPVFSSSFVQKQTEKPSSKTVTKKGKCLNLLVVQELFLFSPRSSAVTLMGLLGSVVANGWCKSEQPHVMLSRRVRAWLRSLRTSQA